ncbi:MAG: hypothetical protein AB8B87_00780 [Granulosicoccus sp.]
MTKLNRIVSTSTHRLLKASTVVVALATLTGCLISPYYGQKFLSRSEKIPFTVYTVDKTKPITIECGKASAHGGLYSGESYQLVKTVWPSTQGMLDPDGNKIYSASTEQALPSDCFRYYNYPDAYDYITVVRVLQNGSDSGIYTFDKAGLACLGEWTGKGRGWFNWLSKGCYKVYSNTGGTIRTVFLKAKW